MILGSNAAKHLCGTKALYQIEAPSVRADALNAGCTAGADTWSGFRVLRSPTGRRGSEQYHILLALAVLTRSQRVPLHVCCGSLIGLIGSTSPVRLATLVPDWLKRRACRHTRHSLSPERGGLGTCTEFLLLAPHPGTGKKRPLHALYILPSLNRRRHVFPDAPLRPREKTQSHREVPEDRDHHVG